MAEPVDEESDHALRAAGSRIVGRHAQARHRAQKVVGIDIGADLAGGAARGRTNAAGPERTHLRQAVLEHVPLTLIRHGRACPGHLDYRGAA